MARIKEAEKEKIILNHMRALDISREEAEQLFEDDEKDWIGADGEKMTQDAKSIRRYEQADKTKRKRSTPVRKENPEKRNILSELHKTLVGIADCATVTNPERIITFTIGENDYEVTLTQKRKQK